MKSSSCETQSRDSRKIEAKGEIKGKGFYDNYGTVIHTVKSEDGERRSRKSDETLFNRDEVEGTRKERDYSGVGAYK